METLISIMSIVFSNSTPKIPKPGIFGSKFKDSYAFIKLNNKKNSRVLTSNMKKVFRNCCPKYTNKAFWVRRLRIFIFSYETLLFHSSEEIDFSYENLAPNITRCFVKKLSETFSKPSSENTCIGVFSFWQLENNIIKWYNNITSYLKSALSNLPICKFSYKNKNVLIWYQKCLIWGFFCWNFKSQHPQIKMSL